MIEYQPGEFGEPGELNMELEKFVKHIEAGDPVTAFHVGTKAELMKKKLKVGEPSAKKSDIDSLKDEISLLKNDIEALKQPRIVRGLTIPNESEIEKFGKS